MIIREVKWRKWLGLCWISVQGEWLEEFNERKIPQKGVVTSSWVSGWHEYRFAKPILDWLEESGGRWSTEPCLNVSDFQKGEQARIWFRSMRNVTMFKLAWGGQTRPKEGLDIQMMKQTVTAKTRALSAKWTLSAPTVISSRDL